MANSPGPRACTPAGIMEMLRRYEYPIAAQAVVVGRSDIVGKPMALLLLHAERHRDHLPFQNGRIWRGMPPRRHPGGRHRQGPR